jgi:glycine cleavage system protein P-like pyridoxal-binding family
MMRFEGLPHAGGGGGGGGVCVPLEMFPLSGFVVSKTKTIQRLSKIFSAYFERLFKDL